MKHGHFAAKFYIIQARLFQLHYLLAVDIYSLCSSEYLLQDHTGLIVPEYVMQNGTMVR